MSHLPRLSAPLAAAVLALSSGCGTAPYDHTEIDSVNADGTTSPLAAIVIQAGSAMEIAAIPMSADGPLGGSFTFDLTSSDSSVLDVQPALGQTSQEPDFVVIGVSAGDARILVTLDETLKAPIPVQVVPQQP